MPVVSKSYIGQSLCVCVPSRCHMPIIFLLWATIWLYKHNGVLETCFLVQCLQHLDISNLWRSPYLHFSVEFTGADCALMRTDTGDGSEIGKRFGVWEWECYWFLYWRASWVSGILDDSIEQSLQRGHVELRDGTAALRHIQSHM